MASSSIDELPSAAETLTTSHQPPSDITLTPVEPIPSSNPTDAVEAVGEKRKRDDDDAVEAVEKKPNLESSNPDPNPTPSPYWKTSLCSYFRREGECSHGSTCKYAHGEAELRQKPDGSWDPTSERGKKAKKMPKEEVEDEEFLFTEEMMDGIDDEGCENSFVVDTSLSKCLVHLPRKWLSDDLKKFVKEQGVEFKFAKKRLGMVVGFLTFENAEQLKSGVESLEGKAVNNKMLKIADVLPRTMDKNNGANKSAKFKSAREAVTPLADLSYADQLEQKKASIMQILKKLTRNARKACPHGNAIPEWAIQAREIGGLACKLEGIIESPLRNGYRNKCEFSVGYSFQGKITVGFLLGNFSAGVTAVEEPVDCPNISKLACRYASIFQTFLEKSRLPVWNKFKNCGFWRQLTVREGRKPGVISNNEDADTSIAEVMLIVQVCTTDSDKLEVASESEVASEFEQMAKAFAEGAKASSPPLPLTVLVVQDHTGISNVAPPDCPLRVLPIPMSDKGTNEDQPANVLTEARIHDHLSNLRFSISPTAFFQVNTGAAEKLYTLAGDWADLGPDTLLFDVCCGTGTIGLTLAHRVGMVIGIEMNASAVSDAERNAKINGISNCKFICSKAETVMSSLLKQYLDVSQMEEDKPISNTNDDLNKQISSTEEMSNSEHKDDQSLPTPNIQGEELQNNEQKEGEISTKPRFKNVVAIVDPPRPGLHPDVIKALRTHPRLKTLVYISCNPETLLANAIELCTPTFNEENQERQGYRRRNLGNTALARHRAKKMPASEAFNPVKAMAVDIFPHTVHCEMVMLLKR